MATLYTLKMAAEVIGLKPETVKYHLYVSGYLKGFGTLVGKTLVFTEAEVNRMREKAATFPARRTMLSKGSRATRAMPVPERDQLALSLQRDGKTLLEIARIIGYSDATAASRAIARAKRRLG